MIGMDAHTGAALSGMAHLKQSIKDILTTPEGTRLMNRIYGTRLFSLLDKPMTTALKMQIQAAALEALKRYEPRLKVLSLQLTETEPQEGSSRGSLKLLLQGKYLPSKTIIHLEDIVL